jgi:putative glutamine amidotransferase
MSKSAASGIVGIVCDHCQQDGMDGHGVGEEYVAAARDGAGALPLLIPVGTPRIERILDAVDGLLLPGAPTNVAPIHYGGAAPRPGTRLDPLRDEASLALIRAAIAAGKPLLAVCRGFQELNVALGGTLHQHVHELPGHLDHREDESQPLEVQYGPAHPVHLAPGGLLARWTGETQCMVNSLHHQGIDRLAPGLSVEATAPDGQIEAVSLPDASGFVLGVQWHPEWRWSDHRLSRAIFAAFGAALAKRAFTSF